MKVRVNRLPVDIMVAIVHESDWETLGVWRGTSRAFFTIVAAFLRRRYHGYLSPFVTNIGLLDRLMHKHGAVISGSVALHYFIPDASWTPKEIDIYVPANKYKMFVRAVADVDGLNWQRLLRNRKKHVVPRRDGQELAYDDLQDYLSDEQRFGEEQPLPPMYTFPSDLDNFSQYSSDTTTDDSGPDSEFEDHTELYLQLEHYTPERPTLVYGRGYRTMRNFRTPKGGRVNVVCSHANFPLSPLRSFWTSLMMNFLTPQGAVCGFPSATLKRQGALKVEPLSNREDRSVDRYRRRGFTFHGEELRRELDMWDYNFFGEQRLLAVDFRLEFDDVHCSLPIMRTNRGWLPDDNWKRKVRYGVAGECIRRVSQLRTGVGD